MSSGAIERISPPTEFACDEAGEAGAVQVMARLRAATSAAHDRIECNPRLASLLAPDLTEAQYQDVLVRYYVYFARTEPGLSAALSAVVPAPDLDTRRKVPLLERDLATLGIPIPAVVTAPPLRTMSGAQALGCLYVHEGASLGGRLIYAALQRNLGQRLGSSRFFEGYGRKSAEVWRCTQAILEAGLGGEPQISEAAKAAHAAFHEIDCIMGENFTNQGMNCVVANNENYQIPCKDWHYRTR